MGPRAKSALLWGVVGAIAFLVLHQAWLLLGGTFTSITVVAATTIVVWAVTVVCAYSGEVRLLQHGR